METEDVNMVEPYKKQMQFFFQKPYYGRKFFYCIDGDIKTITKDIKKDIKYGDFARSCFENGFLITLIGNGLGVRMKSITIVEVKGFCEDCEIVQFGIEDIPDEIKSNMPTGHPIKNSLYIGHPHKANKYIPFENYEAYLLSERLDEFCWICQNLGAKEIHLVNENSLDEFCDEERETKIGLNGQKDGFSGNTRKTHNSNNSKYNANFYKCKINQVFSNPVLNPRLPEDLIWYEYEDSWKNLYRQSLLGKGEYHVNIETGSVCVTNESESVAIKANIKVLRNKAGLNFSDSEDRMFMQRKNAVLDIVVKF